jgi:uncharacterized protein YyaL (SSP411 family)
LANHLKDQTSPYLLQHKENPVNWYAWGKEAFEKAEKEDKPIFLSIGYSTCHWCHVMARESFEDEETAKVLNEFFVSIKVDKEERPDIDSIYMQVCQAFTGSGGWPLSIFMTPSQKPFLAGTYFPKKPRYGLMSFNELLLIIKDKWQNERNGLLDTATQVTNALKNVSKETSSENEYLIKEAYEIFKETYDEKYGGFSRAPKFPSPHNLLFLMDYYKTEHEEYALKMAEFTLLMMYKGGIFDHIGYGFCRYSTDRYFLVPHFEKMLYDNALLILAYCEAYSITKNPFYKEVAEKVAFYISCEMTSKDGGFYSAEDADSDGIEGKYYVFLPSEIEKILPLKAAAFNKYFDITKDGNFEGKSIPNLLKTETQSDLFDAFLPEIREYRKNRTKLHKDDKILTSWNSLMISALSALYKITKEEKYIESAKRAQIFIEKNLSENDALFASYRNGKRSLQGFIDDYAYYIFALFSLYDVTLDEALIEKANKFLNKAVTDFFDFKNGGFYLYGKDGEQLITRPKETYDGAMPSGNSIMAYNLVRMNYLSPTKLTNEVVSTHLAFMSGMAENAPAAHAMFLIALSNYFNPPTMINVVLKDKDDIKDLCFTAPLRSIIKVHRLETKEYKLLNDKTTYYVCKDQNCLPPVNKLDFTDNNSN